MTIPGTASGLGHLISLYNLDADDYIAHNSLGILLKKAIKHDADILGFETQLTNDIVKFVLTEKQIFKHTHLMDGIEFIKKYRDMRLEIWWYIIKKDFIHKLDLEFEKNEYCADVVFTLSLLKETKKMVYLPIAIHRYVQAPNSIMRNDNRDYHIGRIENIHKMAISFSKIINSLDSKDRISLNNLKFRRDTFVFFNLIKMIKTGSINKTFKMKINELKEAKAYPIRNFIGEEYNSLLYRFLLKIINKEIILLSFFTSRNIFKSSNKKTDVV